MRNGWVKVVPGCEMPPFGKNVLCYYTIKSKKELFEYIVIAHVDSATEGDGYKYYHWLDNEHNVVNPLYYHHLPDPPKPEY